MYHCLCSVALLVGSTAAFAQPISVCPLNPHYFQYKGKPVLLITSDHHYGAVIDRDFDFAKFLNYLGDNGMNLTRIYPGGYFEIPDEFLKDNPLGPHAGRQILPWAKSTEAGASPTLAEAGPALLQIRPRQMESRILRSTEGVRRTGETERYHRRNRFLQSDVRSELARDASFHRNNIQNVGRYEGKDFYLFSSDDARNADVMARQAAYIAKITQELNEYDNVIFDICDEPELWTKPGATIVHWISAMKDAFLRAEGKLPKKHLLGQTVRGAAAPPCRAKAGVHGCRPSTSPTPNKPWPETTCGTSPSWW